MRAHFIKFIVDDKGEPLAGADVTLRNQGTNVPISETIFANDEPSAVELSNPILSDQNGKVEFYLTAPKRLDILVAKQDFASVSFTVDATKLATNIGVREGGVDLASRSSLNFDAAGFEVADDSGFDETDIKLKSIRGFDDVSDAIATNGQILVWNSGLGMFVPTSVAAGVTDHGALSGLGDDDHAQYHNNARGDARYPLLADLNSHLTDPAGAHAASAISILDVATDFTATDVEGALAELQSDHEADAGALTAHIADAADAHAATAITNTPEGSIAAATVQAAINELALEKAATVHGHEATSIGFHGCKVTRGANQAIPDTVATVALWTLEDYDTDAFHSTITNTGRITIPAGHAGLYAIKAQVAFAEDVDNRRGLWILKNGTDIITEDRRGALVGANLTWLSVEVDDVAVVGDYYEVVVFQNSGSGLALDWGSATDQRLWFSCYLVGI